MRTPPSALYDQVLDLALAITNAVEMDKEMAARTALTDFYRSQDAAGLSDPFLTEAVADFETDPQAAAVLYRLAIDQASLFPGEALYTKQLSLAERLIELGETDGLASRVSAARIDALAARDEQQVEYADALLARLQK